MRRFLKASGRRGAVLGLSGGVDSAVVAKLCCVAFGKKRTAALILPAKPTSVSDINDAATLAESLGIHHQTIPLSPALESINALIQGRTPSRRRAGNIAARLRMMLLYDFALSKKYLVAGTSNRSELLTGYFTKHGDGASDFLPLGALYKTEVFELAGYLGIPKKIVGKPPSAGLWKGQTDEKELGMSYEKIDRILRSLTAASHTGKNPRKTANLLRLAKLISSTRHKRHSPPILEPFIPQA